MKKILAISLLTAIVVTGCAQSENLETATSSTKQVAVSSPSPKSSPSPNASQTVQPSATLSPSIKPSPSAIPSPSIKPSPSPAKTNWKAEVKSIASGDGSETAKFDAVTMLARSYAAKPDEIKEFEKFIVNEFKSGNYLADIKNDEYMLANIFRSTIIERYYDDKDALPIDAFAFDFLQNTKYTYRGADTVDSESVKSNEKQMKRALEKIK